MQCPTPDAPFVVVNCGALPSGLIEAALFGYEKGAFTGAAQRHQGFFQQAHGGTLFLDEIGELPLELQPKLLDVLERKCIRRLGSEREEPVSFRLISATHKNLPKAIADGTFREDLFFRISVVDLEVPPLRERREDIPLLAKAFLKSLAPNENILLGEDAIDSLQHHIWPGNIRQLRNALEKTVTFLDYPVIDKEALFMPSIGGEGTDDARTSRGSRPVHPTGGGQSSVEGSFIGEVLPSFPLGASQEPVNLKDVLAATERILIEQALDETDRNVQEAAHLLSISPAWLYNCIKKYGLSNKK
jgi:DNA-binding NtrC family response regulator